jgi:hypothetical protein
VRSFFLILLKNASVYLERRGRSCCDELRSILANLIRESQPILVMTFERLTYIIELFKVCSILNKSEMVATRLANSRGAVDVLSPSENCH